jgi:glycosyltransferase involved in cell wall biosynthesis
MINILQLHSSAGMYGAESVILSLGSTLGDEGYHPIVGSIESDLENPSAFAAACIGAGLDTELIHSGRRISPGAIVDLARLIRRRDVRLLHSHSYKATIFGYFAARLAGIPLIETNHLYPPMPLDNRKLQIYARIGAFFLRFADRTVAVSQKIRTTLAAHGVSAQKIDVIENGIDFERCRAAAAEDRSALRKRLGIEEDRFIIGGIGRLTQQKGFEYLLEAVPEICRMHEKAFFIIAGDGPLMGVLKHQALSLRIGDRIRFLGFRPDVLNILALMEIFVMPSLDEGLPMAMLEAMAIGVPAVLTRVGEIPHVVQDGRNGFLVEPRDSAGLADGILRLIGDPMLRKRLKENGLQTVMTGYTDRAMSRRYRCIYDRLIPDLPPAKRKPHPAM